MPVRSTLTALAVVALINAFEPENSAEFAIGLALAFVPLAMLVFVVLSLRKLLGGRQHLD